MSEPLNFISLGAGVQSSTMLLMALHGEITPRPDCAIFADTQWEPKATYDHLAFLESVACAHDFTIHRVTKGNIRADAFATIEARKRNASLPLHVRNKEGEPGILRRQCTREYKIEPLVKMQRELVGLRPRQRAPKGVVLCEVWIGISTDEASRMKDSRDSWQVNRWPLIEKRMSRADCKQWLTAHGYPIPPKSACIGCPFHDNHYWREMRNNSPDEWADAIDFDLSIRSLTERGVESDAYVHRSLVPLSEVDLSTAEERGQLNMFINECEGMCGV